LALLRNVVHSLASWSIGRSFKAGSRAGRSVRREPFDADELALDAERPLDGALRLHVVSFADGAVIDAAVRVARGRASPVVVVEGASDFVVVVDRDQTVDPSLLVARRDAADLVLE
jgi:hypothetical protein